MWTFLFTLELVNTGHLEKLWDQSLGNWLCVNDLGNDADHCKVLINIKQQSPNIAQGVHGHFTKKPEEIGIGDQGHMFGYATNETDQELMPLIHVLPTKLGAMLTKVRKNGTCECLP
ncbi:hypothetical protein L7F22_050836 [Adiantum nelumboides]|nr:hypothetical protein [Adiantum nelumboides]